MSNYHNDQPIQGGQNDPDLLNRTDFARQVGEALLLDPDDECLTVSLEGEWGYGKTSVINLIKRSFVGSAKAPVIIEYNPWLAGKPESLIQDFLLQFASQLNIRDSSQNLNTVAKELIAYSSLFSVAKLVPGAEPWASILEKTFFRTGTSAKKIAKLKELDLLKKKQEVIKVLKKIRNPIVVIIDDIDRLTPPETFQVLRLVKAVADFPGTSFLLAFDPNYFTAVLKKNDIVNTSEYINKVIQLRIPLPVVSDHGLKKLVDIELSNLSDQDLTESFESDRERLDWIFFTYFMPLISNLRELKRLFNYLRFVLLQIEGQVCFSDLFGLAIIRTKANPLYEHLRNSPEAYIGQALSENNISFRPPQEIVNELGPHREKLLETIDEKDRKLIEELIHEIFPLTNRQNYSPYGVSNADSAGRVAAPQRLKIALHITTPIGYISDYEVEQFILGNINRIEFMESLLKQGAYKRFFEMMMHYLPHHKDEALEVLVSIYDVILFSEQLKNLREENYSFLSPNMYKLMSWLTIKVISTHDDKFNLALSLIQQVRYAPMNAQILFEIRKQFNDEMHDEKWVSIDELQTLEEKFQQIAVIAILDKLFLYNHLESEILYELKRSSLEQTRDLLSIILPKESGVLRVAEIIGYSGYSSHNGPYAHITEERYSDVIDFSELKKKASQIELSSQPIHLQAMLKSIMDGRAYYLRDGTPRDDQ